jgi:hypothetical protein
MSREQALFPECPTLGRQSAEQVSAYLRDIGDEGPSRATLSSKSIATEHPELAPVAPQLPPGGLFGKRLFEYTEHAFGYIAMPTPGMSSESLEITDARSIVADSNLKGQLLKVTLDRLRVADYPGGGIHHVLVDFYAEHQVPGANAEPIHFTQKFRVQEGQGAGIVGYPIFLGLRAGNEGVAFKAFTVNVRNDDDERALAFLESETFSSGLKLITASNPAVAPLTGIAKGLVQMVLSRNKNRPVQDFYLGLDFSNVATRAKLREGAYVAVQIPDDYANSWRWSDWALNRGQGTIGLKAEPSVAIPYNYLVFSVSSYTP